MPGRTLWIILFFLIFCLPGKRIVSQIYFLEKKYNLDSLEQVYNTSAGVEKVRALCLLAYECRIYDPEKSTGLAETAYHLASGIDDPEIKLLATYTIGIAYHHQGNYPKAIRYGLIAQEMAYSLNDTAAIYQVAHCVVLSYLYSNNPDLAIQYTEETLQVLKAWRHPAQEFEKTIRSGWINMMAGRFHQAIPYFLQAEKYAKMTDLVPPNKIALTQTHLVNCYIKTENYDSALCYLKINEAYCKEWNVDFSEFGLEYKGVYYFLQKKYDSSLACYNEMFKMAKLKGNMLDQASNLYRAGEVYEAMNLQNQAVESYSSSVGIAAKLTENRSYFLDQSKYLESWYTPEQIVPHYIERNGLRLQKNSNWRLYQIYKAMADPARALSHLEAFNNASEKLNELDRHKDVIEINTRYETERKEQQILLLTSENKLNSLKLDQTRYILFGLAGFFLLAVFVALLLIRQNRMKTIQDKTTLEQRLLRAQMNPHFLFNTLTNIQSYLIENDTVKAGNYLSRFARLMRNILDNTSRELVPLEQEIRTIENYLELQKLRFHEKFDYDIAMDARIDPESTFIPPMLAQPFIENAIEHGIRHLKIPGFITVKISMDVDPEEIADKFINVEVTDNGIGRMQAEQVGYQNSIDHRPMATSITRERLKILSRKLNRSMRRKVALQITDLYDSEGKSCGTKVLLVIPADLR